ncbi:TetR family transcriptional regulator C-terminal domain-containing protein [Nonomuraea rubra]|uniref:TetR family transcriptional regulator C-terminal domain-containing protein n=1 Tax=Nonomuraea rubra TaxID=46180 RepID=UPI0033F0CE59
MRAVLHGLLPVGAERRTRHLGHAACFVRFLTDPDLAKVARDAPRALENLVASQIAQGQDVGAAAEAAFVVASTEGLQSSVLLRQRTADEAITMIDPQLARVFTTTNPAAEYGESA